MASRREPLEAEDIGDALLEELDELAGEAVGEEEAEVEVFSSGSGELIRYGYAIVIDGETVRADGGYDSILALFAAFEEWCESRGGRGEPATDDEA